MFFVRLVAVHLLQKDEMTAHRDPWGYVIGLGLIGGGCSGWDRFRVFSLGWFCFC